MNEVAEDIPGKSSNKRRKAVVVEGTQQYKAIKFATGKPINKDTKSQWRFCPTTRWVKLFEMLFYKQMGHRIFWKEHLRTTVLCLFGKKTRIVLLVLDESVSLPSSDARRWKPNGWTIVGEMQLGPSNTVSLNPKPLLIVFQAPCMCSIDAAYTIPDQDLKNKQT